MSAAGSLVVNVVADTARFSSGLQQAQAQAKSFAGGVASSLGGTLATLGGLGVAAAGIGGAISTVTSAISGASAVETQLVAFQTLLGSAEKAKSLIADIQRFAAETPFESPEITAAAKSLLAFGSSSESVVDELRRLGDISAGVSAPIGDIASIYGKARVQGRLFMEDINQLTGRGIPIIEELAKQFGVTQGEVRSLVEKGQVDFGNLEQAFVSLTNEGGRFSGLMAAQSQTTAGLFSSLKDNVGQSLTAIGQQMIEAFRIKDVLAGLVSFTAQAPALMQAAGDGISGAFATASNAILATLNDLVPGASAAFASIGETAAQVADALPFAWRNASSLIEQAMIDLELAAIDTVPGIEGVFSELGVQIAATMESTYAEVKAIINNIGAAFSILKDSVVGLFSGLGAAIGAAIEGANPLKAFREAVVDDLARIKQASDGIQDPGQIAQDKFNEVANAAREGLRDQGGLAATLQARRDALQQRINANEQAAAQQAAKAAADAAQRAADKAAPKPAERELAPFQPVEPKLPDGGNPAAPDSAQRNQVGAVLAGSQAAVSAVLRAAGSQPQNKEQVAELRSIKKLLGDLIRQGVVQEIAGDPDPRVGALNV